jgi:hypothetical protein
MNRLDKNIYAGSDFQDCTPYDKVRPCVGNPESPVETALAVFVATSPPDWILGTIAEPESLAAIPLHPV